ncbi:MAG: outer rane receptor for ferrienterochelin and colicin [Segetibacter sp.]|nr:outer rane receptor for ferrienterochelin and colicin [Segetibacter sp.]
MLLKRILHFIAVILLPFAINAQTTTSSLGGFVKTADGEPLIGATVTALHVPTGSVYRTQTKTQGKFDIGNMNPGGPYSVTITYVNFQSFTRDEIYLTLGESSKQDFTMSTTSANLGAVTVTGTRSQSKGGIESNIGRDRLANLPTVGRNISDMLRAVPQAKLTSTEGAISIAGQNNRYNAFYIDGALNNDVFGLAASGTNGGQANIPPISLDAIDQIQVSISPYDASLSGFTGGGINAVTRSGTNNVTGSIYSLYRNEKLTGKTPTGEKSAATRLSKFADKTTGFRVGGPIIKNKLFYFLNAELVRFERPQTFDTSFYRGATRGAALAAISDTLMKRYNYNPGSYINNPEKVSADRVVAKVDWNINTANKLSLSYRYNAGERYNVSSSSTGTINFYNNGYVFPTKSHTVTGELRSNLPRGLNNRLLLTYANNNDNRDPIGTAFPRVTITDGTSGRIVFGPDNSSTINLLTQKNYNLMDIVSFNAGKHRMQAGVDFELNDVYNAFIQNTFGNYTYNSLADFYNNAKPAAYSVGYPLIDNKLDETTAAAAKFKTMRGAIFFNDEYRANENLTLNFGLRADKFSFITQPATDSFTNNVAIPKFSQYYDLRGARSGLKPNIPVLFSPRLGLTYRIPEEKVTIRAGVGYFTGRIPLVWPAGIYNNNGINQGGFTSNGQQNMAALDIIRFRSNPGNQYRASDVGISLSKGPLNLVSADFKLPKVFRASMGIDKQLGHNWTTTLEGIFTKNINEIYYTNINILPPVGTSQGAGSRTVYPLALNIPITAAGTNPYDNAILVSNAPGKKGFSYNLTAAIDKRFTNGFAFNTSYSWGEAVVVHEPTSSVNVSQWRFIETVNGRNNITRSTSDFSPGHRVLSYLSKRFEYANKALSTTITLFYTGQSGSPFSYVYQQGASGNPGPVRDDPSGGNDLVYVPTASELQSMTFLNNTVSGVVYTPQQQKDALEAFIANNEYLNGRRGQFTERNGDRLPFTNLLDLKLLQDFNFKIAGKKYQFQLTYDMFNFTNFLNREWGRTYFTGNDNYAIVNFAGYVNANSNLTPQYRFNPTLTQPGSANFISTSSAPSYSARWTSQLGVRFNF